MRLTIRTLIGIDVGRSRDFGIHYSYVFHVECELNWVICQEIERVLKKYARGTGEG